MTVVAVSRNPERAALLDPLLVDANDYDVIVLGSLTHGYSRIKQVQPDLILPSWRPTMSMRANCCPVEGRRRFVWHSVSSRTRGVTERATLTSSRTRADILRVR